jgi:DUF4097 and DUF4098 domain-containing protein YvlB
MRFTGLRAAAVAAILATTLLTPVFAAEGHFERTLKVSGPVELEVATGSGSIKVRAGEASSVRVYGTIRSSGGLFGGDAERKVRYLESNPPIEQHGNVIKVGRLDDPELQRNISLSYELVVPVETRLRSASGSGNETIDGIAGPLEASTGSGHIGVSNLGGEVRASTGSGGIEVRSVKGSVHASTGSGTIRATGIAGGLRASTGSGNVTLEQTAPGDVEVGTGSGSIELRHVRGTLRAHTGSGTITAEGEGAGTWRLETASGSVTVQLPAQQGFELHARTVSGRISTDRSLTVQGRLSHRELHGKVGNGGFLLDVSTVSGNIRIE